MILCFSAGWVWLGGVRLESPCLNPEAKGRAEWRARFVKSSKIVGRKGWFTGCGGHSPPRLGCGGGESAENCCRRALCVVGYRLVGWFNFVVTVVSISEGAGPRTYELLAARFCRACPFGED